jgi:2-furoyl-CoA dehydrogenase 2Fe-2S iron sulfur subunit
MPLLIHGRRHKVAFTLNGASAEVAVEPRILLTDALRHGLGATGTHVGCEHGVCGACTIMIDGQPARACLTLAVQVEGCKVTTVEGLAPAPDRLSVLQRAFRRHHALQCGFCTAGILISLECFLATTPSPSAESVREVLAGHLCRCTGYTPIVAAALEAAAELHDQSGNPERRDV